MDWLNRILGRRDPSAPDRLPSPDALVLLASPEGEPEAMILRDILADAGIRALVKNRDAVSVNAGGMGGWWAFEIWVLRRDLARARDIIGAPADSPDEDAAGAS